MQDDDELYILEDDEATTDIVTTSADDHFQSLILDGKSPEEASFSAYPAKKFPIKYALAKIANKEFVRANYHTLMNKVGFTEEKTAHLLMQAANLALEDEAKSSTALLNVVKEAHKIYDLYPVQERPADAALSVGTININDRSQMLQKILIQARQEMPGEQIDSMVESANIGQLGVIPKKELFENVEEHGTIPD